MNKKLNREEKLQKQTELQNKIIANAKVNLVNCGHCGSVMLHEVKPINEDDDIECPFCDFKSEPCDFPDYFYEGFEQSATFTND